MTGPHATRKMGNATTTTTHTQTQIKTDVRMFQHLGVLLAFSLLARSVDGSYIVLFIGLRKLQ